MEMLILCVVLVAAIAALAYNRASLTMFTAAIAIILAIGTALDVVSTLGWVVFLLVALPLNIASVRQQYLTKPLLKLYRKIMPEMSSTEKEAIDAGTTWWESDLFRGNPDWHKF